MRLFNMGAAFLFQKACVVSNGKPALPPASWRKHWPVWTFCDVKVDLNVLNEKVQTTLRKDELNKARTVSSKNNCYYCFMTICFVWKFKRRPLTRWRDDCHCVNDRNVNICATFKWLMERHPNGFNQVLKRVILSTLANDLIIISYNQFGVKQLR